MFVVVFLCCVVLCMQRPLRGAYHSSKGVLLCALIISRNLRCEAAKVLAGTVESLVVVMILA
jgi:hypothetical protein